MAYVSPFEFIRPFMGSPVEDISKGVQQGMQIRQLANQEEMMPIEKRIKLAQAAHAEQEAAKTKAAMDLLHLTQNGAPGGILATPESGGVSLKDALAAKMLFGVDLTPQRSVVGTKAVTIPKFGGAPTATPIPGLESKGKIAQIPVGDQLHTVREDEQGNIKPVMESELGIPWAGVPTRLPDETPVVGAKFAPKESAYQKESEKQRAIKDAGVHKTQSLEQLVYGALKTELGREPLETEVLARLAVEKNRGSGEVANVIRSVTGGKKQFLSELDPKEKAEVDRWLARPTIIKEQAKMDVQAGLISDDAKEQAYQFLKTTGNLPPEMLRLAWRFPGALKSVQNYIAQRGAQDGLTGMDRAFAQTAYKSLGTEFQNTARRKAATLYFEGMLRQNTDALEQQNLQVLRTKFPAVNNLQLLLTEQAGDPDVVAFKTQLGRVATEWAKITSGSLGIQEVSVTAQQNMNRLIKASANVDQLKSLIQTIRMDAAHSVNSVYQREASQKEELYNIAGTTPPEPTDMKMVPAKINVGNMEIETLIPKEMMGSIKGTPTGGGAGSGGEGGGTGTWEEYKKKKGIK